MFSKLETYIKSYLRTERQELALEELGGFRAKKSEPVISRTGDVIIPERTMVSFEEASKPTDLHFVEFCAKQEGISTAEAEAWTKSELERIFDYMNHGKPWVIYGIGKFLLDGHNDLIYIPMVDQNLLADDEDPAIKLAREEQAKAEAEAALRLEAEEKAQREAANAAALSSGTYASVTAGTPNTVSAPTTPIPQGEKQPTTGASGAIPPGSEPGKKGEVKTKADKEKAKKEEEPKKKKRRFLVPFIIIIFLLFGTAGGYYYMASHGHIPDMLGVMHYFGHVEEEHEVEDAEAKAEEQRIADSLATAQAIADSLALEEEKVREQLAKLLEDEKPKPAKTIASKPRAPKPAKKVIDKDTGEELDTNFMNVKVPDDVMARSQGVAVSTNNFNVPVTAKQTGVVSANDKYAKYQIITCELPNVEDAVLCSEAYAKKGFNTFVTDFSQGTFKVSIARANDRKEAERMAKILREKLGTRVEILELAD